MSSVTASRSIQTIQTCQVNSTLSCSHRATLESPKADPSSVLAFQMTQAIITSALNSPQVPAAAVSSRFNKPQVTTATLPSSVQTFRMTPATMTSGCNSPQVPAATIHSSYSTPQMTQATVPCSALFTSRILLLPMVLVCLCSMSK